jgi:hypothetical protein
MISIETLKTSAASMAGDGFALVLWRGEGRIAGSDDTGLDLLVRGIRARYTWDRLDVTLQRLLANHTLGVDELGGGHDAVGIVSLFALLLPEEVTVLDRDGLLVLRSPEGTPIHQYADMARPR